MTLTPKDKAKELVKKFEGFGLRLAKQCALIAVENQIRFIEEEMIQINYDLRRIWIIELIEVKNEIERL